MTDSRFDSILRAGSRAWRRVAPSTLRGLAKPVMAAIARQRVLSALQRPQPERQPGPLLVSGFFSETRGISEAARLTLAGLAAAGFGAVAHDLRPMLAQGPGRKNTLPVNTAGGVWLIHANAPEAMHALSYVDPFLWSGRYRIGYWVFELPRVPNDWVEASRAFHEIWAPSQFVADALMTSGVTTPVRVMPHPVAIGHRQASPDRARFGIGATEFAALVMADLRSSAARKNTLGAIEIYTRAFPQATPGRRLIVKVQSSDPHPSLQTAMEAVFKGRDDILCMKEPLSTEDTHRLIASSDVVLSPHRAEGFGLPLAEAFMFGVPALATGWSGNLDFMGSLPELLIGHTLVPVRDPYGIYRAPAQHWAEPDLSDAVQKLKTLAKSSDLRRHLAARGKQAVEAQSAAWSRDALAQTELARWAG